MSVVTEVELPWKLYRCLLALTHDTTPPKLSKAYIGMLPLVLEQT